MWEQRRYDFLWWPDDGVYGGDTPLLNPLNTYSVQLTIVAEEPSVTLKTSGLIVEDFLGVFFDGFESGDTSQ